ncbi:hypothetical protein EP30_09985 [Bifidobacterium sp. UTCIF-39]|nr:hypothetical protein EP30_09985 [Bifidobacterium sp. UTCIF-39]
MGNKGPDANRRDEQQGYVLPIWLLPGRAEAAIGVLVTWLYQDPVAMAKMDDASCVCLAGKIPDGNHNCQPVGASCVEPKRSSDGIRSPDLKEYKRGWMEEKTE